MSAVNRVPIQVVAAELVAGLVTADDIACPHDGRCTIRAIQRDGGAEYLLKCQALENFTGDPTARPQCKKLQRTLRGNGCPFVQEDKFAPQLAELHIARCCADKVA